MKKIQYNNKQRRLVMQENIAAYAFMLPFLLFLSSFLLITACIRIFQVNLP